MKDKCASCAYWQPEQQICVALNQPRQKRDFCSFHTTDPKVCATCGKFILGNYNYNEVNGQYIMVCEACQQALSTCAGCKTGNVCSFESDPSPLPKMIQQNMRQGNMIIQTTVRNPERVRLLCEKCPCFNHEGSFCNREFNTCGNLQCILNS